MSVNTGTKLLICGQIVDKVRTKICQESFWKAHGFLKQALLFIFGLPKIMCSSQYSIKAETSGPCNLLPIQTFPMVLLALTMKSMGEESGQSQNKNLTRHYFAQNEQKTCEKDSIT